LKADRATYGGSLLALENHTSWTNLTHLNR